MKLAKKQKNHQKNSMKTIGIIVAMDLEMALLSEKLSDVDIIEINKYKFYQSKYENNKVIFTTSGIGKVNASIVTTLMINFFKPDLIIHSGIAGGYQKDLKPLEIVVADKLIYSDVDMTSPISGNFEYGRIQDLPRVFYSKKELVEELRSEANVKVGTMITGDQFNDSYEKVDSLVKRYFQDDNVLSTDMESCAIAHVAYLNNVDVLVMKAISDLIGKSNGMEYSTFAQIAANNSANLALKLIKKIT